MDWPLTGKETVSPLQNGEAWIDYETKVVHEYHQVWHSVGGTESQIYCPE